MTVVSDLVGATSDTSVSLVTLSIVTLVLADLFIVDITNARYTAIIVIRIQKFWKSILIVVGCSLLGSYSTS
jgi:hypothetical protein